MTEPERADARSAFTVTPPAGRSARKLSHLIARDLRGMILRGELAQGQPLPSEGHLIQSFEVSRDTLREAMRILESESLIRIRRGRGGGAVVQRPHPDAVTRHVSLLLQVRGATMADIHEVRHVVEPAAVARLGLVSPDAVSTLAELHELELSRRGDPLACMTAIVAFDQAVFRSAGNKTIGVVSGVFRDLTAGQTALGEMRGAGPSIAQRLTACHADVLDALATGDPRRLRASWVAYLSATTAEMGDRELAERFDVAPVWRAHGREEAWGAPEKLAASLARDIRIRIAEGTLVDGDQLAPMRELAAEYGVSRPSIREGLRILEVEGLIDLRTGSRTGARILEPTTTAAAQLASVMLAAARTQMIDVLEARLLVEPSVVELVAERGDEQTLAELVRRADVLDDLVEDIPSFVDYIGEIERRLFAAAGNPAISVALEMIHWVTIRCRRDVLVRVASLPQVARSNRLASKAVKECVRLVAAGDVQGAVQCWTDHLEDLVPYYRQAYGDRLIVDLFD